MIKKRRQEKLLELINAYEIDTQQELVERLNTFGFNTAQATVSRDIKDLEIVKISGKNKKNRYAVVKNNDLKDSSKMYGMFKAAVISIVSAQNIVVVKTLIGNAHSAGATIDKLQIEEIIGCVSGDDTIIIVTKDGAGAIAVERQLKELL